MVSTLVIDGTSATDTDCFNGSDGTATVSVSGGQAPYQYSWDAFAGSQLTPTAVDLPAGTYTVTVTDVDGCIEAETVTVGQPDPFVLNLGSLDVRCFGESNGSVVIENASGGTGPYVYSLTGDGFIADTIFQGLPSDTYTVTIQDANGCLDSLDVFVDQPEELLVTAFPLDTTIVLGQSVNLEAYQNQENTILTWTPSDSLSCTDCNIVTAMPTSTTQYNVMVTDTINGCTVDEDLLVRLNKVRAVYVPNVFSPNNDGVNDFVFVYADASVEIIEEFRIFDRWGELVFEGIDFQPNQQDVGWDGKLRGKEMQPAVFVYFARVRFIDGKELIIEGDITLTR